MLSTRFEQYAPFIVASLHRQVIGQPASARHERCFAMWQTITRPSHVTTVHQAAFHQPSRNVLDRSLNPRIMNGQETDQGSSNVLTPSVRLP
jgi:hypothetical protein